MLLNNITLLLKSGTFERLGLISDILLCKNIEKYYADYF